MRRILLATAIVCVVQAQAMAAPYGIRLRRFINGQPTSSNMAHLRSDTEWKLEGHFAAPIDAFFFWLRISPFDAIDQGASRVQISPAVLSFSPEFQEAEYTCPSPAVSGYCDMRASVIVDFNEPFESRKIPAVASTDYMSLVELKIRLYSEGVLALSYQGPQEFTINGGTAVTATVEEGHPNVVVSGFLRGDANESGTVTISDVVRLLYHLFVDPTAYPIFCEDEADANDDGTVDIADPLRIVLALFSRATIPEPYPRSGADPTADSLFCP